MHWLSQQWHKFVIAFVGLCHLRNLVKEFWETGTFIERRLYQRRKVIMSLSTVIKGIPLAATDALALSTFLTKLPVYLPVIQKQLSDLQKFSADRSNPAALISDSTVLLGDLNTDIQTIVPMISNLLPKLKATTPAES